MMSTTLPPGRREAGFSTIFWKIHGCDERRAIFSRTCGRAAGRVGGSGKVIGGRFGESGGHFVSAILSRASAFTGDQFGGALLSVVGQVANLTSCFRVSG